MKDRRDKLLVTGMGAISPLGMTLAESWNACREGRGAIAAQALDPGRNGPPPFTLPVAFVPGDPTAGLETRLERRIGNSLDRFALYGLCAAEEALADAGLKRSALTSASVVMGHGMGGIHTLEANYEKFYGVKTTRVHPLTVPKVMVSAPASAIAIEFGVKGPVLAVATACASSGHAIAQGALMLQAGLAEIAIVGGSEAIASPASIAAWDGLRAMSPTTCRPFSSGRDGMVIGEGAAVIILETETHAIRRGARIYGELAGYGMTSDANHWTQPSLEGASSAMQRACATANMLDDEQILISTHGTGTPLNDANETAAIHAVFGKRAMSHPVIATKSAHGHLIGAATGLQAALGLCALHSRMAPPILNFLGADPECALNLVIDQPRPIQTRSLLVNSFAFGGLNASLAFRLHETLAP